ncbi:hypothetical protein HDV62DRAFT_65155 [Trichoderma sp. SZMC 28011]
MEFGGFMAEEFAMFFSIFSLVSSTTLHGLISFQHIKLLFFSFHFDSRTELTLKMGLQYAVEWFILEQTPFMAATSTKLS